MDKKKIVFFIGSMSWGGAEKIISVLAHRFLDENYDVTIVTLLSQTNVYKLDQRIKLVSLAREKKNRFANLFYWTRSVKEFFINEKPDIAVSFIGRINLIVCKAKKKSKSPCRLIISERNDRRYDGRGIIEHFFSKRLYKVADLLICQTKIEKELAPKNMRDKTIVVPNPVFLTASPIPFNQKEKVVITAGRLEKSKNQLLLIDAFVNVISSGNDCGFELHIYGNGNEKEQLIEYVGKKNMSDKIKFFQSTSDIQSKLSSASIFCLPSNFEGMSNSLMEALLLGTPSISTDVSGARDLIEHDKNGYIVPVGDLKMFTERLEQLILSTETRLHFYNHCLSNEYQTKYTDSLDIYVSNITGK